MNSCSRKTQYLVWGGLALVILAVTAGFIMEQMRGRVPANQTLVSLSGPISDANASERLPVLTNKVSDFQLTNQFGKLISNADLKGKIWVADIIFTRCPGPCAKLTQQMRKIQAALPPDSGVSFVSLTADPEYDTPEILKAYGKRFKTQPGNWHFLTGKKKNVYDLARHGLLVGVQEVNPAEVTQENDLFIHDIHFVLIDRDGQIRGYFDGTEPDASERVLQAIKLLKAKG